MPTARRRRGAETSRATARSRPNASGRARRPGGSRSRPRPLSRLRPPRAWRATSARRGERGPALGLEEMAVDQVEHRLILIHVELPRIELRRGAQRLEVAGLEDRRAPPLRPVDVAQVVVHDRLPELRAQQDRVEEDLVGDVDVAEEGDDVGPPLDEAGDVLDAVTGEAPVRAAAVGAEAGREPPLERRPEVPSVEPEV